CITVMAEKSKVDRVSQRVREGDTVEIENINLTVIETPGHTPGSLSFYDAAGGRVFSGDTLFIRGTGRTDFQGGSARAQYESIFNKLLTLPDDTLVYPGHDYKGDTVSTIAEEKAHNPRLQVNSAEDYVAIMDNLNLPNPKMMDVAVPANLRIGLEQDTPEAASWSLTVAQVLKECERPDVVLVDLREAEERARHGVIPSSIHAPYKQLDDFVKPGGLLREMAAATGKRLIYYCAVGERSAMAVDSSKAAGLDNVCHLKGGMEAWAKADAPIEK
ncbi:MAG: rhodanese-like domain-containing protein, partial [Alphaproteobacteria bacterium]